MKIHEVLDETALIIYAREKEVLNKLKLTPDVLLELSALLITQNKLLAASLSSLAAAAGDAKINMAKEPRDKDIIAEKIFDMLQNEIPVVVSKSNALVEKKLEFRRLKPILENQKNAVNTKKNVTEARIIAIHKFAKDIRSKTSKTLKDHKIAPDIRTEILKNKDPDIADLFINSKGEVFIPTERTIRGYLSRQI